MEKLDPYSAKNASKAYASAAKGEAFCSDAWPSLAGPATGGRSRCERKNAEFCTVFRNPVSGQDTVYGFYILNEKVGGAGGTAPPEGGGGSGTKLLERDGESFQTLTAIALSVQKLRTEPKFFKDCRLGTVDKSRSEERPGKIC